MSIENATEARSDRMPNRQPIDFIDSANSGTLSASTTVPTFQPISVFRIWPTPVKPPGAILLGIRNSW